MRQQGDVWRRRLGGEGPGLHDFQVDRVPVAPAAKPAPARDGRQAGRQRGCGCEQGPAFEHRVCTGQACWTRNTTCYSRGNSRENARAPLPHDCRSMAACSAWQRHMAVGQCSGSELTKAAHYPPNNRSCVGGGGHGACLRRRRRWNSRIAAGRGSSRGGCCRRRLQDGITAQQSGPAGWADN